MSHFSYSQLFSVAPPSLVRVYAGYDEMSRLLWRLRADRTCGMFVAAVRGGKMAQRQGVFDQFSAAFQFPCYFGENWNAFLDCVRDLGWLRADGFVALVQDANRVLVGGDADELGVLLKILEQAGAEWSHADEFRPAKPFHVLLHSVPEESGELERRLRSIGRLVPLLETHEGKD